MKKIILLYDFLKEPGGLERVMATQARYLSQKYSVQNSFSYLDSHSEAFRLFEGVSLISHGIIFKNQSLRIMLTFLFPKIKDADLYISHSFMCSTFAYRKKLFYKKPYFVYLHHPPLFLYLPDVERQVWSKAGIYRRIAFFIGKTLGFFLRFLDKKAVCYADKVFVNSLCTQKRIKKIYDIDAEVCYPSISGRFTEVPEKKVEDILRKFKLPNQFALSGGRIIPDKRFDWLLEIFSKFQSPLVMVGSIKEEYKQFLMDMVHKLKIEVYFVGFVSSEELVALYNKASVFCFTAPQEDFGLVPIEAMSCGTPVVAWDDGAGPSETVISGVNGYLAKPYDIEDFAKKIQTLIKQNFKKKNKQKILRSVDKFREGIALKNFNHEVELVLTKS